MDIKVLCYNKKTLQQHLKGRIKIIEKLLKTVVGILYKLYIYMLFMVKMSGSNIKKKKLKPVRSDI